MRTRPVFLCAAIAFLSGCAAMPDQRVPLVKIDHYLTLKSSAPGMAGAETKVYVREIPAAASSSIPKADRAVVFVHGGAFPGSTVFDPPHADHSWMRYFANAGYDTFALEFTGFGFSTRPPPMSDPCNLAAAQQAQLVPAVIPAPCAPSHPKPITTMESEWEELAAVVDFVRKARGVDKVAIVAWSRGGPRTSGYLIRNPGKVSRVFALAPDYDRKWPSQMPAALPSASMQAGTRKGFDDSWKAQTRCASQADPAVQELIWKDSIASDPVGSKWGSGMRRQLPRLGYGVNPEVAKAIQIPVAMAAGAFDNVVTPAAVKAYFDDLGSSDKVFIDLACSSHYAMWERNQALLFRASLEWIRDGKIGGISRGEMKLGY